MDPVTMMVGSVALPILGGIIGNIASSDDADAAREQYSQASNILKSIQNAPDIDKPILIEKYKAQGVLTPEMEQAIAIGPSKVAQLTENADLKAAQLGALRDLQARARTGLTPQDRANLSQIRQQLATDTEGKQQQIIQGMQRRGLGGSGAELAAQLANSQQATQNAAQAGEQLGAQASQNAMNALAQSGSLGGQIRAQDFDVNRARASAEDENRRFGEQNSIQRQRQNVGSRNQAAERNLSESQRISESNINREYAEQERQRQAQLSKYQANISAAAARAGGYSQMGNMYQNQANQTRQMWSGIGGGAGSALGAGANYAQNQNNADRSFNQNQQFLDRYGSQNSQPAYSDYDQTNRPNH